MREIVGIHNKFAIFNLILRNLKLRYRKSILGILWTTLIPAFNALVFFFAFKVIFKTQTPNYLMFLISGVTCWGFFSQSVLAGLESIAGHHGILNKVPVAPSIFPLAEVIGVFINLLLSIPILILVSYIGGNGVSLSWFLVIPWIFLLFLQGYFLALFSSVLFVFFRDLRHIAVIVLQAWFYLTPVVYQGAMVPEKYEFIKFINPVWGIFNNIHSLFLNEVQANVWADFGVALIWTIVLGVVGVGIYSAQRKFIVERL